jgi:hypothetical protein
MRDPQSSPWVSILSHGHRRLDDLVPKWSTFDIIRYSLSWLYNNTFHIIVPICTNHYRLTNNNSTLYPYYNNRYQNISNVLQDTKLYFSMHQKKLPWLLNHPNESQCSQIWPVTLRCCAISEPIHTKKKCMIKKGWTAIYSIHIYIYPELSYSSEHIQTYYMHMIVGVYIHIYIIHISHFTYFITHSIIYVLYA